MVWNFGKNYKCVEDQEEGEWEKVEKQEDTKFSLRDFLSSEYFIRNFVFKITPITLILKFFLFYYFAYANDPHDSRNRTIVLYALFIFVGNFLAFSTSVKWHRGYARKMYVQEEFRWERVFQDYNTYANIYDFLANLVLPLYMTTQGVRALPHLIFGLIQVPLNVCILYGFYHCDFVTLIDHWDHLMLYDSYEENYDPVLFSIIDSTNDYITLKNMSEKELQPNFHVTRKITDERSTEGGGTRTVTTSCISFEHNMTTPISPSGVVKFVTLEYNAVDGELVFPIHFLRSFGPRKGTTVKTSAKFLDDDKEYTVQFVQKYHYKREPMNGDPRRRVRRDALAH